MPLDVNALSHSAAIPTDQHAFRRDLDFHWRIVSLIPPAAPCIIDRVYAMKCSRPIDG
jgi:hypothetical protein